jgi:hypothetical protein
MSWRVAFSIALRADIHIAGPALAESAIGTVLRFAEKGEGTAYPFHLDASVWRFFVPGGTVYVRAHGDVLEVLRIIPDHPLPVVTPLLDEPEDDDGDE